MADRARQVAAYLETSPWRGWRRAPLAGDASNRRYERLCCPATGATVVLMDAPPERGEDIGPFVSMADYLTGLGLSAPRVLAQDLSAGLLVLEDLGDDLFAQILQQDPNLEDELYAAATDVLVALSGSPVPEGLAPYDPSRLAQMVTPAFDWYVYGVTARVPASRDTFCAELETGLAGIAPEKPVTVLRDYHAENLIWLPNRKGIARVGLLDFQDALQGHPAYDLVSLLTDARRDVAPDLADRTIARFVDRTGADPERFDAAFALLSVQRNLRILGVFARLSLQLGKPHYVDFIPRVWRYLDRSLSHPALKRLAPRLRADLPAPTPAILRTLKEQCATAPTL